jgi:uncharacterized protein YodC (DUF2158 family)
MIAEHEEVQFRLGQLVKLASGGPGMKIIGFSPNGRVWCQWEQSGGRMEEASFRPDLLIPGDQPIDAAQQSDITSPELVQVIAEGSFSDRDILDGVLEVLLSLAEKVAGKSAAVILQNRYGHRCPVGVSKNKVFYL